MNKFKLIYRLMGILEMKIVRLLVDKDYCRMNQIRDLLKVAYSILLDAEADARKNEKL